MNEQHWPSHWIGVKKGWELSGNHLRDELVTLPPTRLKKHAHVLGATGSGKTTLLHHLMAQDILLGHSFVVLDLRGDLVNAAIALCQGQVDPSKLKIIDLREKSRPFGFNPLTGAGEPYFRALGVLDAIASQSESWGVQLAETMRYALLLLASNNDSLTSLERLLTDEQFRAGLISNCDDFSLNQYWARFDEMSAEKRNAFVAPVMNKVSMLLATPTLRRILGHPQPIQLGAHLDTPGSVTLVSLAVDEVHAAGRMLGNIVLSSVCREMFSRVNVSESERNKVRLYVDEFENFEMEPFESILAEGRRFGLSLILSHQTLAQLTTKMRSMVLNNVGTKIVMQVGREDSAHMNRDLFGDAKAFEFFNLKTGEAVLWSKSADPIYFEVNEPLFHDVGVRDPRTAEYLKQVMEHAGSSVDAPPRPAFPPPTVVEPVEIKRKGGLDEWL